MQTDRQSDLANRLKEIHLRAMTGRNVVRLVAPNSANGNPRRMWLITNPDGGVVGTHWEGYSGEGGLSAEWPDVETWGPTINLPNGSELKRWRGMAAMRHTEG